MFKYFSFLSKVILITATVMFFGCDSQQAPKTTFHKYISDVQFLADMALTTDGGILITGLRDTPIGDSLVDGDIVLLKLAEDGDVLWSRTYELADNYAYGQSVLETSDGYVILAYSSDDTSDQGDMQLFKTDKNGNTLWSKTYHTTLDEYVSSVRSTQDGGILVLGWVRAQGIYLCKATANGDTLWTKIIVGTTAYTAFSLTNEPNGSFIMTGSVFQNGKSEMYVMRIDGNGNQLLFRTYGFPNHNAYSDNCVVTGDGGFVLAGEKDGDLFVLRANSNGDTLWTKQIGGTFEPTGQSGESIMITKESDMVIAGITQQKVGDWQDALVIRFSDDGNILWSKTFGDSNTYNDRAFRIKEYRNSYLIGGVQYGVVLQSFLLRMNTDGEIE